jgi:hypothetical protein
MRILKQIINKYCGGVECAGSSNILFETVMKFRVLENADYLLTR